jgi:hypothetical protein
MSVAILITLAELFLVLFGIIMLFKVKDKGEVQNEISISY